MIAGSNTYGLTQEILFDHLEKELERVLPPLKIPIPYPVEYRPDGCLGGPSAHTRLADKYRKYANAKYYKKKYEEDEKKKREDSIQAAKDRYIKEYKCSPSDLVVSFHTVKRPFGQSKEEFRISFTEEYQKKKEEKELQEEVARRVKAHKDAILIENARRAREEAAAIRETEIQRRVAVALAGAGID